MGQLSSELDKIGRSTSEPSLRIGRLPSPSTVSPMASLFSNLHDFLFERPVKFRAGQQMAFRMPGFGEGMGSNLKELFHSGPKGEVRSGYLVKWDSGVGGFWQNLRDSIFPPKLPPLKVSSKPLPVPEIWSKNSQFTRVQALSLAFHVVILVLVIIPFLPIFGSPAITQASGPKYDVQLLSPYKPITTAAKKAGGGGGGGAHEALPASKGRVPKFSWAPQLTPPSVRTPNARLQEIPTLQGPPELHVPNNNAPNWGDPLAKVFNDSNGPGSGGGIGSGSGGGVGSGTGGGLGPGSGGGTGGGIFNAGTGGYGDPTCVYCPNPAFSDAAMKAKYQGVVTLSVVVTPDGRATDIRVIKGVGLGLDEKAIEAVRTWRFRPALGPNGKPATVRANIEVTFRIF